jgi:RNA polymerase sigma-70 factor (ECF subfamily)
VLALGADTAPAQQALGDLSQRYVYPVYACLRRCGQDPAQAQINLQRFLHHLSRGDTRDAAERSFRRFLLDELLRFLQRSAVPDCDGVVIPASQLHELEGRYGEHRGNGDGPESAFNSDFARELVQRARKRLQFEAAQAGREALYAGLSSFLTHEPVAGDYEVLSRALQHPPLALVSAIRRLRQRFRELVERELAETVANTAQLTSERLALHSALRAHA